MAQNQQNASAISRLVETFLAKGGDTPQDIDSFCSSYSEFLPGLRDALMDAVRVRKARIRALQDPSEEISGHFSSSDSADGGASPQRPFGRYLLGNQIGGGGFGEVYEAIQRGDSHLFAVKILRDEHRGHPEIVRRFRNEAQILARLGHPGIVPVHEIGEVDGRPYIVMPRIRGVDLHRFSRAKPLDPKSAARMVAEAADACHCANEAGVVHRDIKPENILVDESGRVMVSDFGLAKQLDAETELTKSLQRLGTPHYMPPEQADPRLGPITRSCDVYGLGATLYFLLTGRPPFPTTPGLGRDGALHQIAWNRPIPPTVLCDIVPAAIERACLKCLEKSPLDRYASAADLAIDLRRFIAGREVLAHPPGPILRARRWSARRPLLAAAIATAAFAIITGSAASLHFASRAATHAAETEQQKILTSTAETGRKTASSERRRREYIADIRDAQLAFNRGETATAARLLSKYENTASTDDPRGFEWHYLSRLVHAPSPINISRLGTVWNRNAMSSSGSHIACTDQEGHLTVFKVKDGTQECKSDISVADFDFFPDGSQIISLVADGNDRLVILDTATCSVVAENPTGRLATCIAMSPDGTKCFVGGPGNDLNLWALPGFQPSDLARDHKRGQWERSLDIQNGAVTAAAFLPNSLMLAIGYENGATQIWDIARAAIVVRGPRHSGPVTGLSFDEQGGRVASQSFGAYNSITSQRSNGQAHIWDTSTGNIQKTLIPHHQMIAEQPVIPGDHFQPYGFLRSFFAKDGTQLITSGQFAVQRWEIANAKVVGIFPGSGSLVHALSMSADRRLVAAADNSGNVRIWPTTDAGPARTFFCETAGIRALCGDGNRLAALVEDGIETSDGNHGHLQLRSERRAVVVWELNNQTPTRHSDIKPAVETLTVLPGAFAHGTSIVAPLADESRSAVASALERLDEFSALAVSRDGRLLAVGHRDGDVDLIRVADNERLWTVTPHQGEVTAMEFAPDGKRLASGGLDRRISLLSSETGDRIATLDGHRREISGLAFSPDGQRLASGSGLLRIDSTQAGEVRLWDIITQQPCLELVGSDNDIYPGVAWSANARQLFAAANSLTEVQGTIEPGRVLVWDIAHGVPPTSIHDPQPNNGQD